MIKHAIHQLVRSVIRKKIELSKETKHDDMREGKICYVIMMLFGQKPQGRNQAIKINGRRAF